MVNFNIEIQGLDKLNANFQKGPKTVYDGLTRAINKSAMIIVRNVKLVSPVKTGNLRRGVRATFGNLSAKIGVYNAPYAIYVHEGYGPHTIYPVRKKALFWPGAMHPVKSVRHPGYKGNPFMKIGLDNSRVEVNKTFDVEIQNILNKLAN